MEPENRPYVDADTEPGDSGTEEWADSPKGPEDSARRGSLADPEGPTDEGGAIDGSPADAFINDPRAIGARDGEADRP